MKLLANIGSAQYAAIARDGRVEGIGLYHTEFLYMPRTVLPTEGEQFELYKAVPELFGDTGRW
jgi:phosphotransferase system enzyme I (PtsI)